ncbi:uncharacterized protein N7496_001455 [Penicillium cataractarum]|uniref:Uncharacterized protein n=1 Tax=Penicillium cataractarum TaxID=2100454 RepID=A0A9W9VVW6_9EURO|nr:uncharacterized protein N7496_001455 [Penicillium cataractarum]KAJ5390387.1 hypothetical protein N7496_001455 [Penicillium cataractarum]
MSVLTIVHRAFPFALPWKRRSSTDKGKDKEIDIEVYTSDRDSHDHFHLGTLDADTPTPGTASLHCDVSHTLHIAVKPSPDHTTSPEDSSESSGTDSDSESQFENDHRRPSHGSASSARARLARVVSWASIVRSQCRWTNEQEKQLLMAEKQLARCQKAWSSEQEVWIAYTIPLDPHGLSRNEFDSNALATKPKIHELSEEKAAHEGFMLMRTRQQEEERNQFRKAWKRRRSLENAVTTKEETAITRSDTNRFIKIRRLQRYGHWGSTLATTESTVLTCQA